MKKLIYKCVLILLLILLLITTTIIYYNIKKDRINKDLQNNINYIVDMGAAEKIPNAYYYVVNNQQDLSKLRYSLFYDKIEYLSSEYTLMNIIFKRLNQDYRNIILTYVDVASGEVVDVNIGKIIDNYGLDIGMHSNIMIDNNHNIFCNYQKRNPFTGELDSQEYCLRYDVDTKEIYIEETRKDSLFTDYFYSQLYSNREFAEKEAMRQHIITNKSFLEANNLSDRIVAIDSGSSLCDFFGYIYIMDINDLPKDNAFFEGEFPELLGLANKIAEGYVMIQLPYELSAEDVVKLFSDNCAEISFEGVYIDEHDSIDGLVHYVDSVEEYNEYINTGAATFSYNYDFLKDNK